MLTTKEYDITNKLCKVNTTTLFPYILESYLKDEYMQSSTFESNWLICARCCITNIY